MESSSAKCPRCSAGSSEIWTRPFQSRFARTSTRSRGSVLKTSSPPPPEGFVFDRVWREIAASRWRTPRCCTAARAAPNDSMATRSMSPATSTFRSLPAGRYSRSRGRNGPTDLASSASSTSRSISEARQSLALRAKWNPSLRERPSSLIPRHVEPASFARNALKRHRAVAGPFRSPLMSPASGSFGYFNEAVPAAHCCGNARLSSTHLRTLQLAKARKLGTEERAGIYSTCAVPRRSEPGGLATHHACSRLTSETHYDINLFGALASVP